MHPTIGDASLFFMCERDRLFDFAGTYVDDSMQCGTPDFAKHTEKTLEIFELTSRDLDNVNFRGINISSVSNGLELSQADYADKVIELKENRKTFSNFRSLRAHLSWICQTRPDISCAVSITSQATDN